MSGWRIEAIVRVCVFASSFLSNVESMNSR